MKPTTLDRKVDTQNKSKISGVKAKKKWVPQHKHFEGSVGEGLGFAFKRKQKAKHEYIKLLRKEKKKHPEPKNVYKDEYPEHLKHLYLAEKDKLKKEAWAHRVNRSKVRMKHKGEEEEFHEADDPPQLCLNTEDPILEETETNLDPIQTTELSDKAQQSIPMSNRMRKKQQKKTSHQKTQEEFERIRENQRKKQEEYLKNKQQREEAIQKYKQKKMDTYQRLCKKTKKGQPNLNVQMEYLLQKIQRTDK
uniref:Coiled-coil domain containing 59 n=1 Tax=Neogobius melanostomus TaxID=47308 RepID=A0A8C6TKQ0_9GOBI